MTSGNVFDIKKYSIHDGPGIRTTVFLKGCLLRCEWCHNPESQSPIAEMLFRENRCIQCGICVDTCPHGAISWNSHGPVTDRTTCQRCATCVTACYAEARERIGREMTVAQVMAEIERDVAFYDESGGGVTLSGGEPMLQRDFARALLQACQAEEIHTVLDTCGFASWHTVDSLREAVDLFLYDLKLMNDDKHRHFTGVPNEPILNNLRGLSEHGHHIIVRVPVIPGVNDDDENFRLMGAFVATLPHVDGVDLLPYHPTAVDKYARLNMPYKLADVRPPTDERMAEIAHILQNYGLLVTRGG